MSKKPATTKHEADTKATPKAKAASRQIAALMKKAFRIAKSVPTFKDANGKNRCECYLIATHGLDPKGSNEHSLSIARHCNGNHNLSLAEELLKDIPQMVKMQLLLGQPYHHRDKP